MIALATFNLVPLGVALVIGIATGRWLRARPPTPPPASGESDPS